MTIDPQWFYWAITTPFVILWAVLFLVLHSWRRALIRVSVVFALVGIAVENIFYLKDYWYPPASASASVSWGPIVIYPEFLFFGAAFAGIALVLYPALFRLTPEKSPAGNTHRRLAAGGVVFSATTLVFWYSGFNSIYATAGGALALMLLVSALRSDLFLPAVISGTSTAVVQFVLYAIVFAGIANLEEIFAAIWYLYDTPLDIRLLSVPLTELVWGFSVGSVIGVFYMYVRGARYSRI